jgi:hypothetical protein
MFIGRREDGTIYGLWSVQQWEGQEELADDHTDIVAFNTPSPRAEIASKRAAALDALQKEQLLKRSVDADAPQAIKDYAAAIAVKDDPGAVPADIKPKG